MPSPSDPGPAARAMAKQFKVLLPPSFHKLRISDALAGCFDTGGEGEGAPEPTALVVSPFGKVWRVEVGRDGDGAFLGRGWAEFLAAHGVGVGWFVVLRHEGGGVLTVKVFDTSLCIKEFGAPAADGYECIQTSHNAKILANGGIHGFEVVPLNDRFAAEPIVHITDVLVTVMTSKRSKSIICKPQFIRIFHPYLLEKMILPARFVKDYIRGKCLNSQTAIILSSLGKFWHIELKNDQSGIFFTGGWSQFLDFHGISNGDVLLLRYEGDMVFKFKAFGLSGCQKDFKNQNTGIQLNTEKQQAKPSPIRKLKSSDEKPSSEGNKRPKSSVAFQIGTSSWIRKKINTYALKKLLSLSKKFCDSIGFQMNCTITLKTKMDSTRSWQVRGYAYENYRYILGEGWKRFCQENRIKIGDLCTFNIIQTTLWHVTITRSTLADTFKEKESPCSSSREHKTNKGSSSSEGTKKPKSSMTSSSKVPSYTRCVYDIGPPSWIRKEMNTYSIRNQLSLAPAFCNQIGLPQHCKITLKTSINSDNSWRVGGRKNTSYVIGLGWKKFCRENKVKVGDVCTFNVIKTTLWHVNIKRSTLKDTFKQKKSHCSSSRDQKTDNGSSSSEGTKKPKSSMASLSKVPSYTRCVYNIGLPSWIRKEMNIYSITKHLSLAKAFCSQIGLQKRCTITLKTTINSNSWQIHGQWRQTSSSCVFESGWKNFCRENNVKVGDICTFNVIETTMWHVDITRR